MVWFKVDDSFYDHPKVAELPDSAAALWVRAGSYCSRHMTDGAISARTARRLCDSPDEAIESLLKSGLWETDGDDCYRFHDWSKYQPTAAEAKATRAGRSVGGQIGNHERWHVSAGRVDPKCPLCRSTDRNTDASTDQSADQLPDRSGYRSGGSVSESLSDPPNPTRTRPDKTPVVQTVEPLTKQDHRTNGKPATTRDVGGLITPLPDEDELPYAQRPRKVLCAEHGAPDDRVCNGCKAEHGDRSYHARKRVEGAK